MEDNEFVVRDPITRKKLFNRLNCKNISNEEYDKIFLDESMLGGVI